MLDFGFRGRGAKGGGFPLLFSVYSYVTGMDSSMVGVDVKRNRLADEKRTEQHNFYCNANMERDRKFTKSN